MSKLKIKVAPPVTVCRGPKAEECPWGPYQFPKLYRLDGGGISLQVHVGADTPGAIAGNDDLWFVSNDGRDWTPSAPRSEGIKVGSDRLMALYKPPIRVSQRLRPSVLGHICTPAYSRAKGDEFYLPDPVGQEASVFAEGHRDYCFAVDDFPRDIKEKFSYFCFARKRAGETEYREELATVDWPYRSVRGYDPAILDGEAPGFILMPPSLYHVVPQDIHIAPDGALWLAEYRMCALSPINGAYMPRSSVFVFRSGDCGKSWSLQGFVPYVPDISEDKDAWLRDGFTEPALMILDDGSFAMLLRTCGVFHGAREWGPMYITRSSDGKFWTRPVRFADKGALPTVCRLECGVRLCAVTRPGIDVYVSDDAAAENWTRGCTIMTSDDRSGLMNKPPRSPNFHQWAGSCCNVSIVPTGVNKAVIAYSDFYGKDEHGIKRKSIIIRQIEIG